jgi:hypothetical protein
MKDEDVNQRHAAAYHEAGQAVMAFYLGGWVNDEGVEIDERRYCGLGFPFGHDAQAKERFLLRAVAAVLPTMDSVGPGGPVESSVR